MKKTLFFLLFAAFASLSFAQSSALRDIYPDTWVATDALGRTMPDQAEVGPPKNDKQRVVGIFYITWHGMEHRDGDGNYRFDVTKVLAQDSTAARDGNNPAWAGGFSFHWGEPEMGYFLSQDEWVARKDLSMLADAGVDVLILDVTNAVRYWDEWEVLFKTMHKMQAEGNKVPRFCFWAFNGQVITVVQNLYDRYYKENRYRSLWFEWDGKPLLLYNGTPTFDANQEGLKHPNPHYTPSAKTDPTDPHFGDPDYCNEFYTDYTREVKEFFTLRTMWWGYYEWGNKRFIGTEDNWSFGYNMADKRVQAMDITELLSTHKGEREQAAVTPAQHPLAMGGGDEKVGVGKSWSRATKEPPLDLNDMPKEAYVPWLGKTVTDPTAYGIYFQERWDEALKADPKFLYLNDWNEWTAGKYSPKEGEKIRFLGRESNFYFVDQYNAEFNRTIQPAKGRYSDNYYMQMAQNIRRYKGVRPIPKNRGYGTVSANKGFDQWDAIDVDYRDTRGDVAHRDFPGYRGLHYTDSTGRNDIVTCKVSVAPKTISFYAETADLLTPHTDRHWMVLLIDADNNSSTGWCGYDYAVNKVSPTDKMVYIQKYNQKQNRWKTVGSAPYSYAENRLQIEIPRKVLGLTSDRFTFDFKWSDNAVSFDSAASLCTHGDSAPNRRFNFRFIWEK